MEPTQPTEITLSSSTPSTVNNLTTMQKYTQTQPVPQYNILPPSPENITLTISIISTAFKETPLFLAILTEVDSIPPTTPITSITQARRTEYYGPGITRLLTSGALLVESGNFSAVAIWEPPGFAAPDFSSERKEWRPMTREWTRRIKIARLRCLGSGFESVNPRPEDVTELSQIKLRPFWHLGFLARNFEQGSSRVAGAVSAVVLPFLERARNDRVPAWLEATTVSGVRMYEFFGFRLVETVTVGVGVRGDHGWYEEGGKGTSGFCMIYDRHLTGDGKE